MTRVSDFCYDDILKASACSGYLHIIKFLLNTHKPNKVHCMFELAIAHGHLHIVKNDIRLPPKKRRGLGKKTQQTTSDVKFRRAKKAGKDFDIKNSASS